MVKVALVSIKESDLQGWTQEAPTIIEFAYAWSKYMPRGKGWVPRKLGSILRLNARHTIMTKHGAILAVESSSLDVYATILREGGTWNSHVLDACRRVLEPGGSFYDIGANVGYMSIEIAKLMMDSVIVTAFEPQPLLARAIAISAGLNEFNNVKVHAAMIGRNVGNCDLFISSHSIHASAVPRENSEKVIQCPKYNIDYLVQRDVMPPPTVMKIDVEGGELEVLEGAMATIRQFSPYIIFESDENMLRFKYRREDIINLLDKLCDYSYFIIKNDHFLPFHKSKDRAEWADILAAPTWKQSLMP